MPSQHYQRVLEQDEQLPAPMRLLTRAMSSWLTICLLALFVGAYLAAAFVPIGGRYLWQHSAIEANRQLVLSWVPLQFACVLLAVVIAWSAVRRLPMRWANLGRFVALIGLSLLLISLSWAWRYGSVGVVAVPLHSSATGSAAPLQLNYTTTYASAIGRELVIMPGPTAPLTLPLDGLPRWNDTAEDAMPKANLAQDPRLAAQLGFGTKITPVAYVADGELTDLADGTQRVTPTGPDRRAFRRMPLPAYALLALRFEVETGDRGTVATTVWLPFEPNATGSLAPTRFYKIDGLGTVGLAFRPTSLKLPFAVAATEPDTLSKTLDATVHVADTDEGRLLQPASYQLDFATNGFSYRTQDTDGRLAEFELDWLQPYPLDRGTAEPRHALMTVSTHPGKPIWISAMVTLLIGVLMIVLTRLAGSLRDYGNTPNAEPNRAPA